MIGDSAKIYDGVDGYVLETTHGYYTDYGYGFAAHFLDLDSAKASCDFWSKTSGHYRIVHNGLVVYETIDD